MKKGEKIITVTSVKIDGSLRLPGTVLEVGKEIGIKEANRFFENDAVKHHFENEGDQGMDTAQLAGLEDLSSLKVSELKNVCEYLGLEGFSSMNKPDLIVLIEESRKEEGSAFDDMDEEELRALAEEEGLDIPEDATTEAIRAIVEAAFN